MRCPQIRVDLNKLVENAHVLSTFLKKHKMRFHYVTKCFCAWEPMVDVLADAGIRDFADARLENIEVLKRWARNTMLLRVPMISEADEVVCLCDVSLNSELAAIKALSDAALLLGKYHEVILMVELGDLREGVQPEDVMPMVEQILTMRGVKLAGLGVNFNCYGGVIPTPEKIKELGELAREAQNRCGYEFEYISGGNSGTLPLLMDNTLPTGYINHLRIGEAFLLGHETSYGRYIPDMWHNVFTLRCEVIEKKLKRSVPTGDRGLNAFGEPPVDMEDRGMIQRAIIALGGQDTFPGSLKPRMEGLRYLGHYSSDHTIFDVTNAVGDVHVGGTLDFDVDYKALLMVFMSKYVEKVAIKPGEVFSWTEKSFKRTSCC